MQVEVRAAVLDWLSTYDLTYEQACEIIDTVVYVENGVIHEDFLSPFEETQ